MRCLLSIGTVLDGKGNPICCELWPGNTADVKTLVPIVDRLKSKFGIGRICIVADRGMINKETIAELQKSVRDVHYILGARMRIVKEIRKVVLADAAMRSRLEKTVPTAKLLLRVCVNSSSEATSH